MKTKRILLLALIALMSWGITGCAEDEAISIVNVMGMQVKYEPQSPEKMPKWLQEMLFDFSCWVCVGEKDGHKIYNVWNGASSSIFGYFFDEDGNYIKVKYDDLKSFVNEYNNWICIYYKEYYYFENQI